MRSLPHPLVALSAQALLAACASSGKEDWEPAARAYCREVASARSSAAQDLRVVTANLEALEATFHMSVEGTTADHLSPLVGSIGTACFSLGVTLGRAEGFTRGLRSAGDEVHRRAPAELAGREWLVAEPPRPLSERLEGVCGLDGPKVVEGEGVAVLRAAEEQARAALDVVAKEQEQVDRAFGAVLDSCAAAGVAPSVPGDAPAP